MWCLLVSVATGTGAHLLYLDCFGRARGELPQWKSGLFLAALAVMTVAWLAGLVLLVVGAGG